MTARSPYPRSFPDATERAFLRVALCDDGAFPNAFRQWLRAHPLDDVPYATMRLLPLVALRMAALKMDGPDAGRLRGVYKLAWVQNQRLLDALDRAAGTFGRAGIRMIALKGVPLLAMAYQNAGARFLGDADVLIDRTDIRRAIAALRADGWTVASEAFPNVERLTDAEIARITKECCLRDARGAELDVHWDLFDPNGDDPKPPFGRWWNESVPFLARGRTYRALPPEDMLLHVLVHGAASNAHRTLRWVTDAVAMARAFPIRWERFVRGADASGYALEARAALAFLHDEAFLVLPASVVAWMCADTSTRARRAAFAARANGTHDPFAGFLALWRAYWRHASGNPLRRVWRFEAFVRHARGLPSRRALAAYAGAWAKQTLARNIYGRILPPPADNRE